MTDEVQEAPEGQEVVTQDDAAVEQEARRLGWRPQDEFDGDPDKWVDASTFVKRGEEPAMMAARMKRLEKALDTANSRIEEMTSTFKEFGEYHSKTAQREFQRAMKELEARQAQAVEAGDLEGVRQTSKEMADLSKEMESGGPADSEVKREKAYNAWVKDNGWFETDAVMKAAAVAIGDELVAKGIVDPEKQLAEIAKRIRSEFPHKFENPRRKEPGSVEGPTPVRRKGGRTWSDLPPEIRTRADKWVKEGLLTKEQYLKDYQWDD